MALLTGVQVEFFQQVGEKVLTTWDFGPACKNAYGNVVDPINATPVITRTTATPTVTVSAISYTPTTAAALLDATGLTVGATYVVLCVVTLLSGAVRQFAIQITIQAVATGLS